MVNAGQGKHSPFPVLYEKNSRNTLTRLIALMGPNETCSRLNVETHHEQVLCTRRYITLYLPGRNRL